VTLTSSSSRVLQCASTARATFDDVEGNRPRRPEGASYLNTRSQLSSAQLVPGRGLTVDPDADLSQCSPVCFDSPGTLSTTRRVQRVPLSTLSRPRLPNLVPSRHPIGSSPSVGCFAIVAPRADGRLSHATSTAVVDEDLKPNVDDKVA
jgi:hypothetical protein